MHKVDRVDVHEAESTYEKAVKAELAREYDRAFRLYVKSAELYLHLSRLSKANDKDESRWKGNAGKALQRAEKIKAFVEKSNSVPGSIAASSADLSTSTISELRLTPIGIDHFSRQQQFNVLKKGEYVNGLVFPLWDEPLPVPSGLSSISQYQDFDGQPKLSPEQSKVAPVWRRPQEYLNTTSLSYNRPRGGILPQDILQHIVTDCSVCASISVCLEHARRFGSSLAESAVYHLAERTRTEVVTDLQSVDLLGGYDIKIFSNGAWRRIVIDDKLPYHPIDGTLMCMSVLSSTDGHSRLLRTWPSILEKGYMKLMGGYDFPGSNSSIDLHAIAGWIPEHIEIKGSRFEREKTWDRVMSGFKNGTRSNVVWEGVEVLASHSYAVIDVDESEGIRTLAVLDTWVKPGQESQRKQSIETLRMSWSDVLNVFDGIYLSWDPARWSQVLTFHGMWKRSGFNEESSTRHLYLKFENRKETSEEVWILLTRHVVDSSQTSEFISLKVEIEDELRSYSKAVDQATIAAKVKTQIPSSQTSGVLSIFTSYEGDSTEIGFTVTVYAGPNLTVAWDQEVRKPLFTNRIDGVLTSKNAGGNCTYPSFMFNPQYHLRISPSRNIASMSRGTKTKVALTMQTSRDIPVNIALVWSQGERIDELVEKELAASSGAYNYGLARVVKDLAHSFEVKTIAQEDAGMYTTVIRGAWTPQTARGGPTSEGYSRNPVFEIDVPSLTQLKHIVTSGAYNDAISGVVTPQTIISAGKYWAVPSTYNPGVEAEFQLIVYSKISGVRVSERGGNSRGNF
ncbi:cysteine proteinase [Tricholoma matsutake]|nr:cysteine proteinase [Tricholoma matsutake 945]